MNHLWTWPAEAALVDAAAVEEDNVVAVGDIAVVELGVEVGGGTSAAKAVGCTARALAWIAAVVDMVLAGVGVGVGVDREAAIVGVE